MDIDWLFRLKKLAPSHPDQAELSPYTGSQPADEPRKPKRHRHARWKFEPGTAIAEGRTIIKRIGGGSANEVFLVWDERLFAIMVAKLLRPDRVTEERSLRGLQREADLLERLAHPGLVRGFGEDLEGPYPHILLDLVEGTALGSLIKKQGALSLQQLLPIALYITAVLQYLANEDIVHLDVKPGNIVMNVTPVLIDLSVARSTKDPSTRTKGGIGTPAYMAPEQCDPSLWPDGIGTAADVWGMGTTLYHAVTGERPFTVTKKGDSDDPAVKYPQIIEEPAPLPKNLPAPLVDLISRMLNKNPQQRPAASDAAQVLESLVEEMYSSRRKRKHH